MSEITKKQVKVEKIQEKEFSSLDTKNMTKLVVNKNWFDEFIKEQSLENIVKYLVIKVFANDENFYEKQKIVAAINVVKSLRKYVAANDEFTLNLVVRNLKAFQEQQKQDYFLTKNLRVDVVNSLITLAFNKSFHDILKNLYKLEK
jgi:hypothetical protein